MAGDGDDGYDVVVVGAGPAGSRAAEAAARRGARVLLLEARKEVGVPVQCAEFLHRKVVDELEVPASLVSQDVTGMVTCVKGGTAATTKAPGCVLDRAGFDKMLAGRAVEAGAILRLGTSYDGHERSEDGGHSVLCGPGSVAARVIIGADGPGSRVGQAIGVTNRDELIAVQVTVELKEPTDETEVFLDPVFAGGYGWLFPKGGLANVGVGVDRSLKGRQREALDHLLLMLEGRVGKEVSRTGGMIPVGGPLEYDVDGVLLCGDAGGFTHPITGGGIHQAVMTGRFAGEAAARYVDGDEGAFEWYLSECDALFGRNLRHAVRRRGEMVARWEKASESEASFERLMRRCWIGFKEYNRP